LLGPLVVVGSVYPYAFMRGGPGGHCRSDTAASATSTSSAARPHQWPAKRVSRGTFPSISTPGTPPGKLPPHGRAVAR